MSLLLLFKGYSLIPPTGPGNRAVIDSEYHATINSGGFISVSAAKNDTIKSKARPTIGSQKREVIDGNV